MAKKQFFITIDTETTINNLVVDVACVITDRKGVIVNQMAVIIADVYKKHDLFYIKDAKTGDFWHKSYLPKKYKIYDDMLKNGRRMLATVKAVNRWLERANTQYQPILTAYNLAFDVDKMKNTGINSDIFTQSFCLWKSASFYIANKKAYKKFCMQNHYFTDRTSLGNLTIKTNAEIMTHFLTGNSELEPHTSLEDVLDYEIPILNHLLSKLTTKKMMNPKMTDWRNFKVKDHYCVL